ncbi:MAG: glutathione S-transferase C-terminal domain-containing protein [Lachnospiraceae bacterium]|nr:glutathione S-transferase C-terminal domain-containing protein [Lachnospiraceae bacterium]
MAEKSLKTLEEIIAENEKVTDEILHKEAKERGVKPRPREKGSEIDERGAFHRQPVQFTTPFGDKEGELKAESGRYHLIWGYICHWSNRASIVRELLGLEDAISVTVAGEVGESFTYGWGFPYNEDHTDPELGIKFLYEAYAKADPNFAGRATIPALVDKTTGAVVNNDYHHLTNYFEVNFRPWQPEDAPDLYPRELRKEIDDLNWWLFPHVNDAPYRMSFAQTLEAYNEAFDDFYDSLDKLEERLSKNRFLFGDYVTDSDVRLFVTLARFDTHYYRNLGPIKKRIVDYENIWGYARDLYEIPAFKNNTHFQAFTDAFGLSSKVFETFSSRFGDKLDYEAQWSAPQNRKSLSRTPGEKFLRHKK